MVSKTVTRGPEAGQHEQIPPAGAPQRRPRGRGRWAALGAVVVVAAGAAAAWRAGVFSPAAVSGTGSRRHRRRRRRWCGGSVGGHAGDGDAGVCGLLHGDRVGRRDADVAAVAGAGDRPGAAAVPGGQRVAGGAAVRERAGLAGHGGGNRPVQDVSQLNHDLVDARRRQPRGTWPRWAGITSRGRPAVRGAAAGGAPGGDQPAGVACRWGRWCSSREATAGQPGDREPGRPGGRAGTGGDLGPARGDDRAGRRAAVAGPGRRQGDGDAARTGRSTPGVVSSVGTVATTTSGGRLGQHHDDPGAGDADRSGRGGHPGPGAGDGVHHHRHR